MRSTALVVLVSSKHWLVTCMESGELEEGRCCECQTTAGMNVVSYLTVCFKLCCYTNICVLKITVHTQLYRSRDVLALARA